MQGGVCVCAARRRCQPCLRPPPRQQPSGQGRSRAGSGTAPPAGSPPRGVPGAAPSPPAGQRRGGPGGHGPTCRPASPAASREFAEPAARPSPPSAGGCGPEPTTLRAQRCRSQGSWLFSLCFPKQMRHLPGGSSSSYGGGWSLRSIPWCRDFSRAVAPQSPLVSDFWAGRERSGALLCPAQLPPGWPRGAAPLSPGHLPAGHEKGETNLITLCEAVEESRKPGPGFPPALGPCPQPCSSTSAGLAWGTSSCNSPCNGCED